MRRMILSKLWYPGIQTINIVTRNLVIQKHLNVPVYAHRGTGLICQLALNTDTILCQTSLGDVDVWFEIHRYLRKA